MIITEIEEGKKTKRTTGETWKKCNDAPALSCEEDGKRRELFYVKFD